MLLIFSDLDGTLLDSNYKYDAACTALAAAAIRDVPIVLSSSKTRAEIEIARSGMGNAYPFIPENGGAAVIPEDGGYKTIRFGAPYLELVSRLQRLARETG